LIDSDSCTLALGSVFVPRRVGTSSSGRDGKGEKTKTSLVLLPFSSPRDPSSGSPRVPHASSLETNETCGDSVVVSYSNCNRFVSCTYLIDLVLSPEEKCGSSRRKLRLGLFREESGV
jgi:hypothetical protein